MKLLKSYSGT